MIGFTTLELSVILGIVLIMGIVAIGTIILYFIFYGGIVISYKYKKYISLDKVSKEFEDLYKKIYYNNIHSMKPIRNKLLLMIFLLFIGAIILIFSKDYKFIGLILEVICIMKFIKYKVDFKKIYKKEIIPSFIKLLNNNLEYKIMDKTDTSLKSNYQKADFDHHNKKGYIYQPDDYIIGNLENDLIVKIWDLHIQVGNRRPDEIFKGLFVHSKSQKTINEYIKISRNKLGNRLRMLKQNNKVEIENMEFKDIFDVYSDNKDIAKQLLTKEAIQVLMEFYNKYKIDYEIVFRKKDIYIRLFTGEMFEPKIFGNGIDKRKLYIDYCILEFTIELTKRVKKFTEYIEN